MISMNQEVGVTFTLVDVRDEGLRQGAKPDIQSEIQSVQTVQASRLGAKIKTFIWIERDVCSASSSQSAFTVHTLFSLLSSGRPESVFRLHRAPNIAWESLW